MFDYDYAYLNYFCVVERNGDDKRRVAVLDARIRGVEVRKVDVHPLGDKGANRVSVVGLDRDVQLTHPVRHLSQDVLVA